MAVYDIRKPVCEILEDKSHVDVLLVNIPSRYMEPREGMFGLPFHHLELSSHNGEKLYGDQDYEPNHGLLSIVAYLRAKGVSTDVFDLQTLYYLKHRIDMDPKELLYEAVRARAPKVIGCSGMTPSLPVARELGAEIRKNCGEEAVLVLGGR